MSRGVAGSRQVPPGAVVISEKLKGSELHTALRGTFVYSIIKVIPISLQSPGPGCKKGDFLLPPVLSPFVQPGPQDK